MQLFDYFFSFLYTTEQFIFSYSFLLLVNCASFVLKVCLLISLGKKVVPNYSKAIFKKHSIALIFTTLISAIIYDSTWILKIISVACFEIDYRIVLFWIRISWASVVVHLHALALFIESLTEKNFLITLRHRFLIGISSCFVIFFLGLALINFNCPDRSLIPPIHFMALRATSFYGLLILLPLSIIIAIKKLYSVSMPYLLKKQLTMLIWGLVIPYLFGELIQYNPLSIISLQFITNSYTFSGLCTLLFTFMLYFCVRKIMAFRFLNLATEVHIPTSHKIFFVKTFTKVLNQFRQTTNLSELDHITQRFFREILNTPLESVHLHIRQISDEPFFDQSILKCGHINKKQALIETFISTSQNNLTLLMQERAFIYHELDFSNFYDQDQEKTVFLHLLDTIRVEALFPIHENNQLIAYIIVDRGAHELYSSTERDEILIFCQYLKSIIQILQSKNVDALLEQKHRLKNSLYQREQELSQCRETIRTYLRSNKPKSIGLFFYRNKQFIPANRAACEYIPFNLNVQEGHPTTKIIRRCTAQAEEFRSPQTTLAKDMEGSTISISAIPHPNQNIIAITISYPELSEILKDHMNLLNDPSKWDYLVYLETTQSGKLINELIPGTNEQFLNFKIDLLRLSLTKQPLLLDMPEDDLLATVHLLHHISMEESLCTIAVPENPAIVDMARTLFGINQLFLGTTDPNERPLLEKLNKGGTLFIKNIHALPLELQEYLADFIRCGMYRVFRSEQQFHSNARIICSAHQNLSLLVQEGAFSQALFKELKHTTLSMPSLLTLSEQEITDLTDEFANQALQHTPIKTLLDLTTREKMRIVHQRPTSIHSLKKKIAQSISHKTKDSQIIQEVVFLPSFLETDPLLMKASRLGKHALKDRTIMVVLWEKFGKNQNKIAAFLGVNRSSVNRRCKEYNLL